MRKTKKNNDTIFVGTTPPTKKKKVWLGGLWPHSCIHVTWLKRPPTRKVSGWYTENPQLQTFHVKKIGHEHPSMAHRKSHIFRFLLVVPFCWIYSIQGWIWRPKSPQGPLQTQMTLKLPIRERSDISHQMEKETDLPNYLWMGYDSFWGVESCYSEIIPTWLSFPHVCWRI